MRRVDVVTIGSAVKDVMFYSDELFVIKNTKDLMRQSMLAAEYGAKIEVDHVFANYGGGALNVGKGLSNFGLKVAPMVHLGKDWVGKEIVHFMRQEKLDTSLVTFDKSHPTGFSAILSAASDREHTIFTYKGASTKLRLPKSFRSIKTHWFYIAPLSVKEWVVDMKKLMAYVRGTQNNNLSHRIRVAWTPGKLQLKDHKAMKQLIPGVEIMILNKDEAIELALNLLGRKVVKRKINQTRYLLDSLKTLGMKNLLITGGKKGAYGLDENGRYYFKASSAKKIVDTVGAGDAFASGFLAAYHKYGDFKKAMTLGSRNSAAALRQIGAQNGLLKIIL